MVLWTFLQYPWPEHEFVMLLQESRLVKYCGMTFGSGWVAFEDLLDLNVVASLWEGISAIGRSSGDSARLRSSVFL